MHILVFIYVLCLGQFMILFGRFDNFTLLFHLINEVEQLLTFFEKTYCKEVEKPVKKRNTFMPLAHLNVKFTLAKCQNPLSQDNALMI